MKAAHNRPATMLPFLRSPRWSDSDAKLAALSKSQAIIEFTTDGTILDANDNFLTAMGYARDEIVGRHHSMFVDSAYRASPEYQRFWSSLAAGEYQAAEYKRIAKGGREIWIQASYNPVFGTDGKPWKVVKFATDVTERKLHDADTQGQLQAINKAQAVIEFQMDGTILHANQNFLNTLGYTQDEIVGRHHSMFVDAETRNSPDYREFWARLVSGQYQAAQYKRIGKGGKEIWIEASYNPIMDMNGKPYKVVKFATDVTHQIALMNSVKQLMDVNMTEISHAASTVNDQATTASTAAMQTSGNVQAVASGAEELHASVVEISQTLVKSKIEADAAYEKAAAADIGTQKLVATAQAMNGIVEMIQEVASQVNLLSLNATIEAARAGEAGKGFAVVATEVKNLAQQASEATDKIAAEISGMQTVVTEVVDGLQAIKAAIDVVRGYVTGVASAVEEQSAVAADMSGNMQSAATAVSDVSASIEQIVAAASSVNVAVNTTQNAASSLAR